jgi:hypothetical protein
MIRYVFASLFYRTPYSDAQKGENQDRKVLAACNKPPFTLLQLGYSLPRLCGNTIPLTGKILECIEQLPRTIPWLSLWLFFLVFPPSKGMKRKKHKNNRDQGVDSKKIAAMKQDAAQSQGVSSLAQKREREKESNLSQCTCWLANGVHC